MYLNKWFHTEVPNTDCQGFICCMKASKAKKKSVKRKPPTRNLVKLAHRIKALRVKKGFDSYELFAYEHGFNRSQWGRYERGEDLRYSSLERVAAAFDMTLEEFFSEGFD